MAKGWDEIKQQAVATQEARDQGGDFLPELKLGGKEWQKGPFIIRFLEQGQDVNNFPVHDYEVPSAGGKPFHKKFTCRSEIGEACPGCEADMKVKRRGVYNLIQRGRPVFRRDKDGKSMKDTNGNYIIDGYRDTVVVANVGGPTAEMLRKADSDYRGLMCRDFQVTYSGDTFQGWDLKVVMDGAGSSNPTPMSEADRELLGTKHDLDAYMKPKSYQECAQIVARYVTGKPSSGQGAPQSAPVGQPTGIAAGLLAGVELPAGGAFGAAAAQSTGA